MSASIAFAVGILIGYLAQRHLAAKPAPVRTINVIMDINGRSITADDHLTDADIDALIDSLDRIRP